MEPNQDAPEVLETPEEEVAEVTEASEEEATETEEEDIETLRAKAKKADDLEQKNKQLFERLKKAEKKDDVHTDTISNKDVLYLAKSDIHEDDLDEVLEMARLKGVSVAEAHKFMKPILAERQEERRTASTTATRSGRSASKNTGDDLLKRAERTGEMPDSVDGLMALAEARLMSRNRK